MNTQKVKILRTFVGLPEGTKIGDIVVISRLMAIAAREGRKVEFVTEVAPPGPTDEELKAGKKAEAKAIAKEERAEAKAEAKEEAAAEAKADLREAMAHQKKK